MNIHDLVDELYEAFADRIGQPLSESARSLPRALRLAPDAVPWSRVFSHEVTLGAPALLAEGMASGASRKARGRFRALSDNGAPIRSANAS